MLTAFAAGLLIASFATADAAPNAPSPAETAVDIPEVSVSAPEPRYVAPTRRDRIGRIWAPVLINGQGPYRLVLDTGATHSAIIPRVAAELGLPLTEPKVRLRGVTGSSTVPSIVADTMEVGDLLTLRSELPIVQDVFGGAEGVLGAEGMRQMRVHIEFNADRITISRSKNQRARNGFFAIPMTFVSGSVPAVTARVGNIRVKAVIDTGAQVTTANRALLEALRRRKNVEVTRNEIMGVTLDTQTGDMMSVPRIWLGDLQLAQARLMFVDLDILSHWKLLDEPTIVIGMDVLGLLDTLIIDYRRRELQVRLKS